MCIDIKGTQWRSFLQGLLTCDLAAVLAGDLVYGYLLTPRSKVIADIFVYTHSFGVPIGAPDVGGVTLSCDARVGSRVLQLLMMYKLRCDVTIAENADLVECITYTPFASFLGGGDPRVPQRGDSPPALGYRYLITSFEQESLKEKRAQDSVMYNQWRQKRLLMGVLEGVREYGEDQLFPMETNGAFINALSWNKGCYVGQELITRTQHAGEVRKYVFAGVPAQGSSVDESPQEVYYKGVRVGKLLFCYNHVCALMLRYRDFPVVDGVLVTLKDGTEVSVRIPPFLASVVKEKSAS